MFEAVLVAILLAGAAGALVALNFGLQRLARPDQGDARIAGGRTKIKLPCLLPEELLRTAGSAAATGTVGGPAAALALNGSRAGPGADPTEDPPEDPREDRQEADHEL